MAYSVERLRPSEETGQILVELWRRNLQMKGEPRDEFSHGTIRTIRQGPATAFLLKHISPTATGEVVGACGLGTRELMVGGERVHVGSDGRFLG